MPIYWEAMTWEAAAGFSAVLATGVVAGARWPFWLNRLKFSATKPVSKIRRSISNISKFAQNYSTAA